VTGRLPDRDRVLAVRVPRAGHPSAGRFLLASGQFLLASGRFLPFAAATRTGPRRAPGHCGRLAAFSAAGR
jgi:hypothetical protein